MIIIFLTIAFCLSAGVFSSEAFVSYDELLQTRNELLKTGNVDATLGKPILDDRMLIFQFRS